MPQDVIQAKQKKGKGFKSGTHARTNTFDNRAANQVKIKAKQAQI